MICCNCTLYKKPMLRAMLRRRSNHKCLLGLIFLLSAHISAQSYDEEPNDDDDHSSAYSDGSDGPDYAKYYAGDASGPAHLTDHGPNFGYVNPSDFTSFFNTPSFFAASNQQEVKKPANGFTQPQEFSSFRSSPPFGGKDYFEEAAQKQKEEHEVNPSTSYISHKVTPPREPQYEPQYKPKNPNNLTPYQKYSFQTAPSTSSANYQFPSTAPSTSSFYYNRPRNLETASSNKEILLENVESVKDLKAFKPSQFLRECKKVNKHVSGTSKNSKPMDCYICKDSKGVNYEECSYGSASSPQNYYVERSKEFSTPGAKTVNTDRYKRYSDKDSSKDDPYEYLKQRNQMYYDSPDFGSNYKHPKSLESEYRYVGEHGEAQSSSEKIAAELLKSGENCVKEERGAGMFCTVCRNKKTGGNYEQCSYTSNPEDKKYAYAKESKFSTADDPKDVAESEEEPIKSKKPQQFYNNKKQRHYSDDDEADEQSERKYGQQQRSGKSKSVREETERIKPKNTYRQVSAYKIPKHFADVQTKPEDEDIDQADYFYNKNFQPGKKGTTRKQVKTERKSDEDKAQPVEDYAYYGEESQKDVEKVLAEFATKDRSKCKKAEKNGMTCYLCVDAKGHQHEECMYVSESRPQSKFQAYHAQTKNEERGSEGDRRTEEETDESKVKSVQSTSPKPRNHEIDKEVRNKGRRPIRVAAMEQREFGKESAAARRKRDDDDDLENESNDEYRVDGERGAFSHETDPVFSKQFGTLLPKFMLTKSEGERIYDQLSQSKS